MAVLGPFELAETLGEGGMGRVWRAVHRTERVAVAIKVLSRAGARDPFYLDRFDREVRCVAALDHPNVVAVYDHGRVDGEAERATDGELATGSPWLAMELATGGSLQPLVGRLAWPALRRVLLSVLHGLAHAHARGALHRDLKPGNVLVRGSRAPVLLCDFGLAHPTGLAGGLAEDDELLGTPHFMAPEQVDANWRAYGPWTDLYALGWFAWVMACGEHPWNGSPGSILSRQITDDPPGLRPAQPVPPELEPWILRLLAKRPRDRFQSAADAAWTLTGFAEAKGAVRHVRAPEVEDPTELLTRALAHHRQLPGAQTLALAGTARTARVEGPLDARERPPVPPTWRAPTSHAAGMHLATVGLGLYGARAIPLVAREAECDELWAVLRAAQERPAAVVLRGPAGVGKSRLAEWLCERGQEVGAVGVLRATHAPTPSPADGLAPMVARRLGTLGLAADEVLSQIEHWLYPEEDDEEAAALHDLVAAAPERALGVVERRLVVVRFIERLAAARPVLLWLDDVQWSDDAMAVARMLLASGSPVLVALTVRDEALAELPEQARALDDLARHDACRVLDVQPLKGHARLALVEAVGGLEVGLAARVAERTAGNPLFAIHLIGDWVQRGLLRREQGGFVLADERDGQLPPDLVQLWHRRLEPLLRTHGSTAAEALELAAVLGQQVMPDEWRRACRHRGLEPSARLQAALLDQRLARNNDDGTWMLVHGMLRDALIEQARVAGRLPGHHSAAAEALAEDDDVARRARHLVGAQRWSDALPLLARAAELKRRVGDNHEAVEIAEAGLSCVAELGLCPLDERALQAQIVAIDAWAGVGQWSRSYEPRPQLARDLSDRRHPLLLARFLLLEAERHNNDSQSEQALRCLDEAETLVAGIDERLHDVVLFQRVWTLQSIGQARQAVQAGEPAVQRARDGGPRHSLARILVAMSAALAQLGDVDRSREAALEAHALAQELGERNRQAHACLLVAQACELAGDLEGRGQWLRESLRLFRRIGDVRQHIVEMNLGMYLLEKRAFEEADALIASALAASAARSWKVMLALSHLAALWSAAEQRRWSHWSEHLDGVRSHIGAYVDVGVVTALQRAADLATGDDRPELAAEALELAAEQYARMDRPEEERALREHAARLRDPGSG